MKIRKIILSFVLLSFILGSCEKEFLETSPTNALSSDVMFDSFDGAQLALNGIYAKMYRFDGGTYLRHHGCGYFGNIIDAELMGEDMMQHETGYGWYNRLYAWVEHRSPTMAVVQGRWQSLYEVANNANIVLLYVDDIVDATSAEKANVKAQAYVARALMYFILIQKYAHPLHLGAENPGVPIYTEPTQEGNPRASVGEVYAQIMSDLTAAIEYFEATENPAYQRHKSHSNLATAYGMAARVALAMREYDDAAGYAQDAIDASTQSLFTVSDLSSDPHMLFNTISSEWIWGFQLTAEHAPGYASFHSHFDSRFLTYASLGGRKRINQVLYDAMSDTDVRRKWWVAPEDEVEGSDHLVSYNNLKWLTKEVGSWEVDIPLMRLAEMYLIKAEAFASAGNNSGASQALYDLISNRDPNYVRSAATGDELMEEIMFHRRIEMWGEGFRNFDLQRRGEDLLRTPEQGHADGLVGIYTMRAGDDRWLWRIPQDEIDANDAISMGDQNP